MVLSSTGRWAAPEIKRMAAKSLPRGLAPIRASGHPPHFIRQIQAHHISFKGNRLGGDETTSATMTQHLTESIEASPLYQYHKHNKPFRGITIFFAVVLVCTPYLLMTVYALFRSNGAGGTTPAMRRLAKQLQDRKWVMSGAGQRVDEWGRIQNQVDVLERQFRMETFGEAHAFLDELAELEELRGPFGRKPRINHPAPDEYNMHHGNLLVLVERFTTIKNNWLSTLSGTGAGAIRTYVVVRVLGSPLGEQEYELARSIEKLVIKHREKKKEGAYDLLDDELDN